MATPQRTGEAGDPVADANSRPAPETDDTAAGRLREQVASRRSAGDDHDAEETLWQGGYSPKAMLGTWILLGLLSIAIFVAAALVEQFPWFVAGGIVLAIWAVALAVYLFRHIGVGYELTTQRFIHQSGVLTRRTDRIEVIDIDDVSYTQGPVQRAFGVGTIRLTGSDRTHPELAMEGIADVGRIAGLIDDVRRKERRRHSLHIESI